MEQPKKTSIQELFSGENRFEIPKYQRPYVWGKNECKTLFEDIISNGDEYFIGAVIAVEIKRDGKKVYQLVDGQQRITAISILLFAIYNKLKKYESILTDSQKEELGVIESFLLFETKNSKNIIKKGKPRLRLQDSESNNDDYEYLLKKEGELISFDQNKVSKNFSVKRINNTYKYFNQCIEEYFENNNKNSEVSKCRALISLLKLIKSVFVIFIATEDNKNAYMLFEALNNRGIMLSAVDLIKNHLIYHAEKFDNVDDTYTTWKAICGYLKDDYVTQERFFRQCFNAFREEINQTFQKNGKALFTSNYLATRSNILDIYEKLINVDYAKLLNFINEKAEVYRILINNLNEDEDVQINEDLKKNLINLEHIQGAPSYLLLLYIYANKQKYNLSEIEIAEIVEYLVKFFVRRNFTDSPSTRNLNKIFMNIVQEIRESENQNIVELVCKALKEQSANDEMFKKELKGDVYIKNVDSTRFLLCYYEQKHFSKETKKNLWEKDKHKKYLWTIEHIFPEGENITPEWVKMIADGNEDEAKQKRVQYTHKLGNLTLSGYNSKLGTMSFESKKEIKENERNIGYKNGLKLNEDILKKRTWKVKDIKDRTKQLVDWFLEEFKL